MNNGTIVKLGLKTLRWLIKIQTSDAGSFRPVGSTADGIQGLASWPTLAKEIPVRAFLTDFFSALAFVLTVVPLHQVRIDGRDGAKAGQLTGPLRAPERIGEHLHEARTLWSRSQTSRVSFSLIREWNVGSAGVLAGDAPSRFSVTDKKIFECIGAF